MDYSDWTIAGHKRVAILTILDDHSRFIISCCAYNNATVANVMKASLMQARHTATPSPPSPTTAEHSQPAQTGKPPPETDSSNCS